MIFRSIEMLVDFINMNNKKLLIENPSFPEHDEGYAKSYLVVVTESYSDDNKIFYVKGRRISSVDGSSDRMYEYFDEEELKEFIEEQNAQTNDSLYIYNKEMKVYEPIMIFNGKKSARK